MAPLTDTLLPTRNRATARTTSLGLGLVMLAQLMLVLDATVVNVALPRIATDLHFSPAQLSWVLNAYALAFGGLLLLGGRVGDVLGRRRTFLAGVVFCCSVAASVTCSDVAGPSWPASSSAARWPRR